MKQILTAILIFCTFNIFGQSWQPEGTKYPNASNEGDTVSVQTRIPLIDDQGLLNYYLPVGDLLELSPNVTWETITGNQGSVNISGFNNDAGYLNNAMADGRYLQSETDPTVPNNVKNITAGNIDSWNNSLQPGENVSELNNDANYTTITATDERYLRRDINDDNDVNDLTLGGLMLPDLPVGLATYDQLVVNPQTGEVGKVSVGVFSFDVGNGSTTQFEVDSTTPELNFVGSGDTSVSFNNATNTVTITSTPGAGGGGAVTSFEGRDGAVTSQAGDYNTSEVTENGNLYFTEGRVRGTTLDGLSISNTPITSTNSFIQALGRLQGQINNRDLTFSAGNLSIEGGNSVNLDSRYFRNDVSDTKNGTANFNGDVNIRSEARFTQDGIRGVNILTNSTYGASIGTYTSHDFEIKRGNSTKLTLTNSGVEVSGTLKIPDNVWMESTSGQLVRRTSGGFVNIGGDGTINPPVITLYVDNEIRLRNFRPIIDDSGYEWMNMTSGGHLRLGYDTPGAITLGGGVNPRWSVGSNNYDLYHQGNLRSNAQNDDRYLRRDVSDIKQGNTTFSSQIIVQGEVITSQDGIRGVNILTNATDGASIGTYTSHDFLLKRGNSTKLTLTSSGAVVNGTVTASNLSGTNTGNQIAGTGLSGTSTLSVTNIAAGSSTSGALRYNGTTKSAGRLYGGSSNPSATNRLNYDGHLYVSNLTSIGDVIANSSSDRRLKDDIRRIENPLKKLSKLTGNEFKWNDKQETYDVGQRDYGVLAQEVRKVLPHAVNRRDNGYLAVDYKDIIPLLIEAIKEQQIEIEELKNLINEK